MTAPSDPTALVAELLRERGPMTGEWPGPTDLDKRAAALIAQQAAELAEAWALAGPLGWIFTNPDTGIEWSEQHPVECGEVPDAEDVQPGYAVHLHHHLIAAWEDARAYAEAAKVQHLAKEAAEAERDELLREKERLERERYEAWERGMRDAIQIVEQRVEDDPDYHVYDDWAEIGGELRSAIRARSALAPLGEE